MMNPGGPVEEAGKTARGLIDAMRDQPYLLASMVLNFTIIGLLFYVAHATHETRSREVDLVYENAKQLQQIITHGCPQSGMRLQSEESRPVEFPPSPKTGE